MTCAKSGAHLCEPRAAHVRAFFAECLVHTKGRWARKAFLLEDWQDAEIVTPLFGKVRYDVTVGRYVRRYRIAWIELARKNGKSELLAGIALYLLVADGEEGAEIYSCARDRDQAKKVWAVAERMVRLSPVLSLRLDVRKHENRIVYERTGSFYEVVAADAAGNLGHNPHGVAFDEVIAQRDGSLWTAMRTAAGTRTQPLLFAATTAGDEPEGFAGTTHAEMARIAEQPSRAPHVFVFMRNMPMDADPFDEANWSLPNPALDSFLTRDSLREEALEAKNDPTNENAFRQFRCNQWVQQTTRWTPMHVYDACTGKRWPDPEADVERLAGRAAWAGLDLAAKFDLTAWCLIFPGVGNGPADVLWRFWLPDAAARDLDKKLNGRVSRWAKAGWLTLTEGVTIDYQRVYADIEVDAGRFAVHSVAYDPWSGDPAVQEIETRTGLTMIRVEQTYAGLSPGMTELMALLKDKACRHHGNPVARYCFDCVEVRRNREDPEQIRPVKPERSKTSKRIDGVVVAAMAAGEWVMAREADYDIAESIL